MSVQRRLERLERTRAPAYAGARELLQARLERADPETRARLLGAVREAVERAAEK